MENKMTGLDFKIREVAGRIRDLREVNGGPYEIRTHLLSCLPDRWPPQAAPQPKYK